jgi:hypothetical protein
MPGLTSLNVMGSHLTVAGRCGAEDGDRRVEVLLEVVLVCAVAVRSF